MKDINGLDEQDSDVDSDSGNSNDNAVSSKVPMNDITKEVAEVYGQPF